MSPIWLIFVLSFSFAHSLYSFKTLFEWSQIEYEFDSQDQRTAAIANGTFGIGSKVQPIDVQYTNNVPTDGSQARYFVTTPRLIPKGIPFTLSIVTNQTINRNPVLRPYPHTSWHINPEACKEKRIVSAIRVWKDECGRLWVIDSGAVGPTHLMCNPQILAFDLVTDELIHKYEVPQSVHNQRAEYDSLIAEVLDKKDSCLDTWLYVADPVTPSLLVYSLQLKKSWRVQDTSFEANEKWTNYTVAGDIVSRNFGIITLALSPPRDGGKRKLAYHALANINESYVYTKELRNVSLLENGGGDIFHTYLHPRNQQSGVEAYDRRGRLHFTLLSDIKINRWNGVREYEPQNFINVADDEETMQYPTAIKFGNTVGNIEGGWVFSTRFQKWANGKLSPNETNFRILFTWFIT